MLEIDVGKLTVIALVNERWTPSADGWLFGCFVNGSKLGLTALGIPD